MRKKIKVKVIPRSKKEKITKMADGRLKVKTASPPEEGKANKRAKELLAEKFKVKTRNVFLIKGKRSEKKIFLIEGLKKKTIKSKKR